jgi:MFS family permease
VYTKKRRYLFFLILPLLLVVTAVYLNDARGPYWLGTNSDPEYVYLLNASNMADLKKVGHIDHPGTTVQVLGAAIIQIVHFFNFSSKHDLHTDVLKRPEYYLKTINTVMVALNALMLLILGAAAYKLTRDIWLSLWLQLALFFSGILLAFGLTRVSPEPLLLFAALLLSMLLIIFAHSKSYLRPQPYLLLMFALVTGFGIVTKITFLPILMIPFLILPRWKNKILYLLAVFGSIIIFTLPIIGMYNKFLHWIFRLLTYKGGYGTGERGLIDLQLYLKSIKHLLTGNPFFSLVLAISIAVLITGLVIPKTRKLSLRNPYFKLSAAVAATQLLGLVMVGKHAANHYLMPVLSLSGILLFFVFFYLKGILHHFNFNIRPLKISFFIFAGFVFVLFNPILQVKKLANYRNYLKKKSLAVYHEVNTNYKDYAKIYYYGSSSPQYALKFGNDLARNYHADTLQKIYKDVYFYDIIKKDFFNFSYNQRVPLGIIQANYGNKIIFQGPRGVLISGLKLKQHDKNRFYEGLRVIDPGMVKIIHQIHEWVKTNIEKGSTLVFPRELGMYISRLQGDYDFVLEDIKKLNENDFLTLAVLLKNPYFLIPSANYYKSTISGKAIKKSELNDLKKNLEIEAVLSDSKVKFSLGRIKMPDMSSLNHFDSDYKEIKIWHPLKRVTENISPLMHTQGCRGKFKFDFSTEDNRNILVVSNIQPGEKDKTFCRFGYRPNKKWLQLKSSEIKTIHFLVKVNIPVHLINNNNYLFIRDYMDKWEREKVYFAGTGWLTYLVSKKVRPQNKKIQIGFYFTPQSPGDQIMIKDIKIFVSRR